MQIDLLRSGRRKKLPPQRDALRKQLNEVYGVDILPIAIKENQASIEAARAAQDKGDFSSTIIRQCVDSIG